MADNFVRLVSEEIQSIKLLKKRGKVLRQFVEIFIGTKKRKKKKC